MEPMRERQPAQADGDTSALRRSLIQHLSASGKLLQAVFAIDRDHFASRFSEMDQGDPNDPFHEIGLATQVVEALAEHLDSKTGDLSAELDAKQNEVNGLREQLRELQENAAKQSREAERQVDDARKLTEREKESRRSDVAEVRSLAAEIIRIGEEVSAGDGDEDLAQCLQALRDAVKQDESIENIAVASDAVLLAWFKSMRARPQALSSNKSASSSLIKHQDVIRALEEQVAQARAQAQASANDASRARTELTGLDEARRETARERERAKEAAKTHENVLNQAMEVVEQSRKRERELLSELDEVKKAQGECAIDVSEAKAVTVKLTRERDELAARLEELVRKTEAALDKSAREHEDLKRQLDGAQEQLVPLRKAAQERDDFKRRIDELSNGHHDAEQKARREQDDLKRQTETARTQLTQIQAATSALAKEREELRAKIDDLKRGAEHAASKAVQEKMTFTQEITALRDNEAKLRSQISSSQAERTRLTEKIEGLERELGQTREHAAGRAREHAQLVEQLRLKESQARDHARGTTAELSQVKDNVARNDQDLRLVREKLATVQDQLERERALSAQLKNDWEAKTESSRLITTTVTSERDRLRREVERLNGEFGSVTKHAEERENQLTLRLTEVSRQLSELKQQHQRVTTSGPKDPSSATAEIGDLQARVKHLERDLANERRARYEADAEWQRSFAEYKQLLSDAREAVMAVRRQIAQP